MKEYLTNVDPALQTIEYVATEFDCGVDVAGALKDIVAEMNRLYAIEREMKRRDRRNGKSTPAA